MLIPRAALLIGGAAIGLVSALLRSIESGKPRAARISSATDSGGTALSRMPRSTQPRQTAAPSRVPTGISGQYSILHKRIATLEAMVEQHDAKLRQIPSTEQIVDAMDQVFERGATALHARFAEQTRAIENLQTVVSQTDELLEKVLDSIYSLQPESPPHDPQNDA